MTADLIKRIGTGPDAESDPDIIREGSGPRWGNFADFILEPSRLSIYFPPYAVASYASGPQESHIPLSALQGFLRTNVRIAVPSFHCGKAAMLIERTICSDVPLARLDRRVAEVYATKVRLSGPGQRDKLQRVQRAWLAKRGAACGGKAGSGLKACLMASYQARAAALEEP